MSLDSILDRILLDGQKKAMLIKQEALIRVNEIKELGFQEAEFRRNQIIEQTKKEADDFELSQLSVARLEARKWSLSAKQEMIQQCFEQAQIQLRSLPIEESRALLAKLLLQGVTTGDEVIVISESDQVILTPEFLSQVNESVKQKGLIGDLTIQTTTDFGGGFILRKDDVEMNFSFPALIKRIRESIEMDVVKILFPNN